MGWAMAEGWATGRRGLMAGLAAATLTLSACAGGPGFVDGAPRLSPSDRGRVQFAMLDAVNALRAARGETALGLDPSLTAAAATHARDMAAQNRPWHFGSDGSSPPQRVARAGYGGAFLGEAISESFETELETLAAWMEEPGARGVVLDPLAREMGLAWHQERDGKLWWTLVTGTPEMAPQVPVPSALGAPPVLAGPGAVLPTAPGIPAADGVFGAGAPTGFGAPSDVGVPPGGFPIEPPVAVPAAPPPGLRG